MDNKETAQRLGSLAKVDIDAVSAYTQAIERIQELEVRSALTQFREDHERHIEELFDIITSFGEEPPSRSRDFKGFLIEGFTAIRSSLSDENALKAMHSNEKITNKKYDEALKWDLPERVLEIIAKNRDDERRHIEYIKHQLSVTAGRE